MRCIEGNQFKLQTCIYRRRTITILLVFKFYILIIKLIQSERYISVCIDFTGYYIIGVYYTIIGQ